VFLSTVLWQWLIYVILFIGVWIRNEMELNPGHGYWDGVVRSIGLLVRNLRARTVLHSVNVTAEFYFADSSGS